MSIKFNPKNQTFLDDCVIEIDYQALGIDNVFINSACFMQVEDNEVIFLNEKKKILGSINFPANEKAISFFNVLCFLDEFNVVFQDKFAKKNK